MIQENSFCRTYELETFRNYQSNKIPSTHQTKSLTSLNSWFKKKTDKNGALLVIPTGGGKTFTAVRFLCQHPLNEDYKVLWLAHTHHLLEQAFYTFAPETEEERQRYGVEVSYVNRISGNLTIRVVSGEQNHSKLADVEKTDDVLICTLQTIVKGLNNKHKNLFDFFNSTSNLFIVFDEAHHTPADTYRELMQKLQSLDGKTTFSLGLTATPHHSNENKKNWFLKIYPQGIIPQPQITVSELQADGVLSKINVLEPQSTDFTPTFSDIDYNKWLNAFHDDIPEYIITELANSIERNTTIANTYNKQKYGKTIIFADRWYQCEAICQLLQNRNVKAGAIYSHVTFDNSNANYRNIKRRDKTQMSKDLEEFRKKDGGLDVLVNINILTEGTDVPSVNTVFITRQTASEIKLRQMIGRALRGPKFNGTSEANIVLFVDNWKIGDIVGEFADLPKDIPIETDKTKYQHRIPKLIPIDLIKKLTDLQDKGIDTMPITFDELFPIGWYETIFEAITAENSEDIIQNRRLILVFKHEEEKYQSLINYIKKQDKSQFKDISATLDNTKSLISFWNDKFFYNTKSVSGEIERNIFYIAKHLATYETIAFYAFEDRDFHRIDNIATQHIHQKLDRVSEAKILKEEYNRTDRYWKTLYPDFGKFRYHYDLVINKLTDEQIDYPEKSFSTGIIIERSIKEEEVSDEVKNAVKQRDNNQCVCCGETKKLQIDHIIAKYREKNHDISNLQTLCLTCHKIKSKFDNNSDVIFNFIKNENFNIVFETEFEMFKTPTNKDEKEWSKYLKRYFNFIFQSNVVVTAEIVNLKGKYYNIELSLNKNINKELGLKKLYELGEHLKQNNLLSIWKIILK